MSYRVTSDEVKGIIGTSLTDLIPFIRTANAVVNDSLSIDIAAGDVSATILKELELWLAAHFIAIRDPQVKSEKVGDAAVTYRGTDGKGLNATTYGQQAIAIDPTGQLSQISAKRAEVKSINTA